MAHGEQWRNYYKQGLVKAIGVNSFQPDRVMDMIMFNEIVPAVNQIETHPFNQQIETQGFLADNKVQIESGRPFAEGKHNIFTHELLLALATKYQKTVAQVILRWPDPRGVVAIPKSVKKDQRKLQHL